MTEILNIENIFIPSENHKYVSKGYVLSPAYRKFLQDANLLSKKVEIKPPQRIHIYISTYLDVTNFEKMIVDAIEHCFGNDRNVLEMLVKKRPIKRGKLGSLIVYAETMEEDTNGMHGMWI